MFVRLRGLAVGIVLVGLLPTFVGCGQQFIGTNTTSKSPSKAIQEQLQGQPEDNQTKNGKVYAQLTEIGLNRTVDGYLPGTEEWDTYAIWSVPSNTQLSISLSGPNHANFDLYVFVCEEWLDSSSGSSNEAIDFTTACSSNIKIYPYSYRGSGNYKLSVSSSSRSIGRNTSFCNEITSTLEQLRNATAESAPGLIDNLRSTVNSASDRQIHDCIQTNSERALTLLDAFGNLAADVSDVLKLDIVSSYIDVVLGIVEPVKALLRSWYKPNNQHCRQAFGNLFRNRLGFDQGSEDYWLARYYCTEMRGGDGSKFLKYL